MCPSRFPRNNRVVTKPPFGDLSHPLGSLLYTQSFGIADEAVADDNGFLRRGHGGGGHKTGEEQYGAEHLHGKILSFENYGSRDATGPPPGRLTPVDLVHAARNRVLEARVLRADRHGG